MKHLGIDYGTKRIGLAVSNNEGTLAFPKQTLDNSPYVFIQIIDIVKTDDIKHIVIGKSLDSFGNENIVEKKIQNFIIKIKNELDDIDVVQQDERGSSIAAASHLYGKGNIANQRWTGKQNTKKREHNDAHAAAIILQRYLDKQ